MYIMHAFNFLKDVFNKKTIFNLSSNQEEVEIQNVAFNVINETNECDEDYLEVAISDHEDDFVHVIKDDCSKDLKINSLACDIELNSKSRAYALSKPEDFEQVKNSLQEEGYEVSLLGTESSQNQGIYSYALVNKKDANAPLTILCRGTQIDASIIADLDPKGPGYTVLSSNIDVILKQINQLMQENSINNLRITGHSLGGALSQLLTHYVLKVKQQENAAQFDKLCETSKIETIVFQSAGVNSEVVLEAKENLTAIKSKDSNFAMTFITLVKGGDIVPFISGSYLFSDVSKELAEVYLMQQESTFPKLSLGNALSVIGNYAFFGVASLASGAFKSLTSIALNAHSEYFYHNALDNAESKLTYGYYSNLDELGKSKIKEVFENNLEKCSPSFIQNTIHRIQESAFNHLSGYTNDQVQSFITPVACTAYSTYCLYNVKSSTVAPLLKLSNNLCSHMYAKAASEAAKITYAHKDTLCSLGKRAFNRLKSYLY